MDIYKEHILDLYKNPLNKGKIDNAHIKQHELNSSCGDDITLYFLIEDDKVKDVKFEGHGCAISIASTSLLTEKIKGMELSKIKDISKEDVLDMLGIELGPTRLRCALLPLEAISKAILK